MQSFPPFDQAAVLVVGDVMLDRYWYGSTSRISPEAPVPVVTVNDIENRAGGAANVALGLAALGVQTRLCGKIGTDEAGEALEQLLRASGIGCALERSAQRPTITKLRVISHHQQMIRLDFEAEAGPEAALSPGAFATELSQADAVV